MRSPNVFRNIANTEEIRFLEWFKSRTLPKLPGGFQSDFWTSLLFQASLRERAIFHAVLSLSSTHKRDTIDTFDGAKKDNCLDRQERFSLRHYVKALKCLQSCGSAESKAVSQVTLVTCIVFIALELLRGHFSTAETHLQYGLKVLDEMQFASGNGERFNAEVSRGWTEEWIVEAFMRLSLQFELFRYNRWRPYHFRRVPVPKCPLHSFNTIREAWHHMDRIFCDMFYLTSLARKRAVAGHEPQSLLHLFTRQKQICHDIEVWTKALQSLENNNANRLTNEQKRYFNVLAAFPIMATIMTEACLQPGNELQYDLHATRFMQMITLMIKLWQETLAGTTMEALPSHLIDMKHSIVDLGWIAPLSFIATKCRNHRIRWQAVHLLEYTSHREGIWDARIMACATRQIVEIEERDFYEGAKALTAFSTLEYPRPEDLSAPTLPESYRLCDVEIEISGTPMEKILLYSNQIHAPGSHKLLLSEFSFESQQWTNQELIGL